MIQYYTAQSDTKHRVTTKVQKKIKVTYITKSIDKISTALFTLITLRGTEVQVRKLMSNLATAYSVFRSISALKVYLSFGWTVKGGKIRAHIMLQQNLHQKIDNLLKGASGQAMQNLNLMLGLPESRGLLSPALLIKFWETTPELQATWLGMETTTLVRFTTGVLPLFHTRSILNLLLAERVMPLGLASKAWPHL
ncbi:hypothetical protein F8388_014458 [Cannabis sativa]|uniref:Uncharacterized protein n=1 Tax=Cannabis sativa TaxID=3483 RepID=A0A7J6FYB8_CANSA|nr:hypothetical protein F8388_014458 [Cannabis sativa]